MVDLTNIVIETDRLRLLSTSEDFVNDIFTEFTKDITKFMLPKSPSAVDETLNFIKTSREKMSQGEELQVVILNIATGEFLGHGGISKLSTDTPELGIWIKRSAHGNKYGREAVGGLKEWAVNNLKFKYLMYPVDKRNVASRKIAESLGGVIGAEYKENNMSGDLLDQVEYRIYPGK